MKNYIFLFFLMINTGCGFADKTINNLEGIGDNPKIIKNIDSDLQPYVNSFMNNCNTYHHDCSLYNKLENVHFVDTFSQQVVSAEQVGVCYVYTDTKTNNIVKTDIEVKNLSYTDIDLQTLIYHELGHCILLRVHDQNSYTIMNAYLVEITTQDWQNKVKDLFTDRAPIINPLNSLVGSNITAIDFFNTTE